MTVVLARLGVLLALACLALPVQLAEAKAPPPPKAHAAACQLLGGRLVPVGARERHLANCLEGTRLTTLERDCLYGAVGTVFGAVVGLAIPPVSALNIARAVVSGGAGGCLTLVLRGG
jgi:hypothetical protein